MQGLRNGGLGGSPGFRAEPLQGRGDLGRREGAMSCPICKCQYGFSLEEIVKDAVRLNGIAERLDFAASRHGVEYGRMDIDGSVRNELI